MTFVELQQMALALPQSSKKLCWKTPAFYVGGKLLARMREDHASLAIKVDELQRLALSHNQPEVYSIPAHYQNPDMCVVNLRTIDPTEMKGLLENAWKQVAPKPTLAQFEKENP